jgi:hypothetical protein
MYERVRVYTYDFIISEDSRMKPHRDAAALAAALTTAAATPVALPPRASPTPANSDASPVAAPAEPKPTKASKLKAAPDTVGITLRPDRALLIRYTNEAANRTRAEGKVISAQQVMLEVLERGLKVKS